MNAQNMNLFSTLPPAALRRQEMLIDEIRMLEQQVLRAEAAEKRASTRFTSSPLDLSFLKSSSVGNSDLSLLRVGLNDFNRLKVAPQWNDLTSSPLNVAAPPKRSLMLPTGAGMNSLDPYLKSILGEGAEAILSKKFKDPNTDTMKNVVRTKFLRSSSFPLPSFNTKQKKARKAKHSTTLLSYKMLWAELRTSSSGFRRELFCRRVSRNKVRLTGKSGICKNNNF